MGQFWILTWTKIESACSRHWTCYIHTHIIRDMMHMLYTHILYVTRCTCYIHTYNSWYIALVIYTHIDMWSMIIHILYMLHTHRRRRILWDMLGLHSLSRNPPATSNSTHTYFELSFRERLPSPKEVFHMNQPGSESYHQPPTESAILTWFFWSMQLPFIPQNEIQAYRKIIFAII